MHTAREGFLGDPIQFTPGLPNFAIPLLFSFALQIKVEKPR